MAKRKRGANEGSIFKLPDGRWRALIDLGYRNGKRWRKAIEAATREQVHERLIVMQRDRQLGFNIAPEKRSVGSFLEGWLESVKADIAPATFVSYEATVRLHIKPTLGAVLLQRLNAQYIHQLKKELLAQPELSARTVKYCLVVLRNALTEAVKMDLIRRNPAVDVDFPKVETAEVRPLTQDEALCFLRTAELNRLHALFAVALALGLRRGEALALKWDAVDLEKGSLRVLQTVQRVKLPGERKGKLIWKEPKRKSRRVIDLPAVCVHALRAHRVRQDQGRLLAGHHWKETGLVFTSRIGTAIEPRNLGRIFRRLLKDAQLRRIRMHDLRHTAASLLLAQGVHPRVVMEILGHSQISVTMNTYSHMLPTLGKQAANKMDEILRPMATFEATEKQPSRLN